MKAIYLLLLLVGFSYSQIETLLSVPDTSSLKTMSVGLGGAMFLRGYSSSTNNGAGIYIVIDSAYAEGIQAFDHPTRGYQWYLMSNQTLNDSSVAGSKIQSATINTSNLANSSVTTTKIADSSITSAKISTSTIVNNNLSTSLKRKDRIFNVDDFGASTSASASTNKTAIQNTINAAIASGADTAIVYFPGSGSRYQIDGKITLSNSGSNQNSIILRGTPGSKIKLTATDTLFQLDGFVSLFKMENLIIHGNGRDAGSVAFSHNDAATGSSYIIKECVFDSISVGLDLDDITVVNITNNIFRQGNNGIIAGYNSDNWVINNNTFWQLDTAVTVNGSSSDGMIISANIFGYDSVGVYWTGGGGFTMTGGYFEGVRNIGSVLGTGSARNILIQGVTYQAQSITETGLTFTGDDYITIQNTRSTGFGGVLYDIQSVNAHVIVSNCYGDSIKLRNNDKFKYYLNGKDIRYHITQREIFPLTTVYPYSNRNPWKENRFMLGGANRYAETWRYTATTDTTTAALSWIGTYDGSTMDIGASKAVWKLGVGLGSPPTASESNRGWMWVKSNGNADDVYISRKVSPNSYTWSSVFSQGAADDTVSILFKGLDINDTLVNQYTSAYPAKEVYGGTSWERYVYRFDDSQDEFCSLNFVVDRTANSDSVWVEFFWFSDTATSGSVNWGANCYTTGLGSRVEGGTWGSFYNSSTTNATALRLNKTRVRIYAGGQIQPNYFAQITLRRDGDGSSGTDDMGGDAYLMYVVVKYLKD